jgi:hypothetical protein
VAEAVRRLVTDSSVTGDASDNTEFTNRVISLADDVYRHGSAALLAEVRS